MRYPLFKYYDWNEKALRKEVSESLIRYRGGIVLINMICPTDGCNSHLHEEIPKKNEDGGVMVICLNCGFKGKRLLGVDG